MTFSIITPSFNQGRYLADCVESVLAQKGIDFEHIVIDANSTDETLEVLQRYPHLKWVSEPDKGMSDGINKGFLRATGDWLIWLNCDDYLTEGALAKVAGFINEHPEADIVHGDCMFVREDKSVIRRKYDHPVDIGTLLFVGCYIPSTSTFFRRSIITEGNLVDLDYKVCMDWEYYLRLLRKGYRFGYIPECLAGFRWHETNTSKIHLERGWKETRRLQREHIRESELPGWLGNEYILRALRPTFQGVRLVKRLQTHGRLH